MIFTLSVLGVPQMLGAGGKLDEPYIGTVSLILLNCNNADGVHPSTLKRQFWLLRLPLQSSLLHESRS